MDSKMFPYGDGHLSSFSLQKILQEDVATDADLFRDNALLFEPVSMEDMARRNSSSGLHGALEQTIRSLFLSPEEETPVTSSVPSASEAWLHPSRTQEQDEYPRHMLEPTPVLPQDEDFRTRFQPFQSSKWDLNYQRLVAYKQECGHCNVPLTSQALGRWVKRQRYQYKLFVQGNISSTMTENRIQKLEEIDFAWSLHGAAWDERYQELLAYLNHNGHCNVPSHYAPNPTLATWVKCQRRQYKLFQRSDDTTSTMTKDRLRKLNLLGFAWRISRSVRIIEHPTNGMEMDPRYLARRIFRLVALIDSTVVKTIPPFLHSSKTSIHDTIHTTVRTTTTTNNNNSNNNNRETMIEPSLDLVDDDPTTTPLTDALTKNVIIGIRHNDTLHYKGQTLEESDRHVTSIVVDDSVTELPDECFAKFFNLLSIEFSSSSPLKVIGEEAFAFCRSLKRISIPASVNTIKYQAFANSGLVNIDLLGTSSSSSLRVIGRQAFQNCHKLEIMELPSSLEEFGSGAFKACYNLKHVIWRKSTSSTSTTSATATLKTIPEYAFCMCHSLTTVTDIPSTVTELGDESFSNCVALTSIHLPDSLERIGSGAFLQCMALTDVSYGKSSSLDSMDIGSLAFEGCSHLDLAKIYKA